MPCQFVTNKNFKNTNGMSTALEVAGMAALPKVGTEVNYAPVTSVGSVVRTAEGGTGSSLFPSTLSMTLDNEAGGAAVNFMVFDAMGLLANALGGVFSAPAWTGATNDLIKESLKSKPLTITSYNYAVSTGTSSQLGQSFRIGQAAINGDLVMRNIDQSQYQRNTQQNDKLLTVDLGANSFTIDNTTGIVITVEAGTIANFVWKIGAQYNSIVK